VALYAKLDGVLLPVAAGTTWPLIDGVDGYEATLIMEATSAEALFDVAKRHGSSLELTNGSDSETYKKLTILGTGPGPTPYQREVVLADRRWTWAYSPLVRRSYNVTRKSGQVRRLGEDGQPLAVRPLVEARAYFPWSLKGNEDGTVRTWKPAEIVRDVLDLVVPGEWTDRDGVLSGRAGKLPDVQNLELSALPGVAIAQVLTQVGGGRIGLFVRPSGQVVLYDRLSGDERELIGLPSSGDKKTRARTDSAGRPQIVGGPLWEIQDRRMERPSAVRVHFVPAAELRCDHVEGGTNSGSTSSGTPLRASSALRYPEDVTVGGRTITESTWGTLPEFLEFLSTKTIAGLPPLTLDSILKGFLHGLPEVYSFVDGTGVWAARAAAIREHLRRTYRITKPWNDRIRALRAYRVSIEDQETGTQGASLVYQDYAEWATWRGVQSKTALDLPENHEIVRNRYSNPAAAAGGSIVGTSIDSLRAAPAQLSIVDEELGIFSVDFVFDFTGTASRYVHSALVKGRIPTADPSQKHCYLQEGHLSPTHELSTIVTVQPATPNDERQLYPIEVKLSDVRELLPTSAATKAEGPVLDVLVDASRELARFAWDDSKAAAIYAAFGEGGEAAQTVGEAYGDPINKTVLTAIAKATAARVYVSFEDHVEGGLLTGFAPGLEPRGTAKSVSHSFGPDGPRTMIDLPPKPPVVSEEPFLPTSVHRLLGRFNNP